MITTSHEGEVTTAATVTTHGPTQISEKSSPRPTTPSDVDSTADNTATVDEPTRSTTIVLPNGETIIKTQLSTTPASSLEVTTVLPDGETVVTFSQIPPPTPSPQMTATFAYKQSQQAGQP